MTSAQDRVERGGRTRPIALSAPPTESIISQPVLPLRHSENALGPRNLLKWGLAESPSCDCGHQQTTNHIVDTRPLTKLEGGQD